MQPSSQPSLQPSAQPSGQPTSRPTSSAPSGVPTSTPTKFPTTSAPSQVGDTNPPTNFPSFSPTVNLDYFDQNVYTDYKAIQSEYQNTTDSYTYGHFYYKGLVVDGTCSAWESYIDDTLLIPFDGVALSALSTTFNGEDYPTDQSYERVITCSDPSIVRQLVANLQLGNTFSISCRENQWRTFVCNGHPVLCANCKLNCVATVACPGASDIINPCQEGCSARVANGASVNFQYQISRLYPLITAPLELTANKTSVDVSMSVSRVGRVYCAAITSGVALSSVVDISDGGYSSLVTDPASPVRVTVNDLSPDTEYDMYCVTENFAGNVMTLSDAQATKQTISTVCCRAIQAVTTFSSVVQYFASSTAAESLFVLGLNARPLARLDVNLVIRSISCPGSTSPVSSSGTIVSPSSFQFDADSTSLEGSFVVRGNNPGCYAITATATSAGTDVYEPLVISTIVRNVRAPTPPPAVVSAEFSNDGSSMALTFDNPTDEGATVLSTSYSTFACSEILDFPGASEAACLWESNTALLVQLSADANELIQVGDDVVLLANTIKAQCLSGTCTSNLYSSRTTLVLAMPSNPAQPTASLSASRRIGSCDDIELDPTGSDGAGGRSWQSVKWTVTSNKPQLDVSAIEAYLNDDHSADTGELVTVPNDLLVAQTTYMVQLEVETFLLQSSVATVSVSVLSTDVVVPQLRIVGSVSSTFRWKSLELFASARFPECVAEEQVTLAYTWKVYRGLDFVPSLSSSESSDPRYFKLSPYRLDAAAEYTIVVAVTVSSDVSGLEKTVLGAFANYEIKTGQSGVDASIAGASAFTTSASKQVTLDASGSADIDYPSTSQLSFVWNCVQVSPTFGASCLDRVSVSGDQLTIASAAFTAGTYNLSVTASNERGSEDTDSVVITYTSRVIPDVNIRKPRVKYNAQSSIILTADIATPVRTASASWTSSSVPNLASAGIVTTALSKSLFRGNSVYQLGLKPYSLSAGRTYTFTLTSAYTESIDSASAGVTIVMNTAPRNGVVTVSPSSGTALATTFAVSTSQWTDDSSDLPLRFTLSYYTLSSASQYMIKSQNEQRYTSTLLGQGLENKAYVVQLLAFAVDIFSGQANASTVVEVLPAQLTTAVVDATEAALQNALAAQDAEAAAQVIGASVNSINAVDCRVPVGCASINREECSRTARTCGECLSGYIGIDGDSNVACQLESTIVPIGGSCAVDASCFSGSCKNGFCADVAKSCPNSCSGRGTCTFYDRLDRQLSFCSVTKSTCRAACVCENSRYGEDCTLTETALNQRIGFRETMCVSLFETMDIQDVDAEIINSRAQSVNELLADINQVSSRALEFCTAVLVSSVDDYPRLSCLGTTPSLIVRAASQVLKADSSLLSMGLFDNVTALVQEIASSCQSELAIGEDPIEFTSDNINLLSSLSDKEGLSDEFFLSVPQTSSEEFNGAVGTVVSFNNSQLASDEIVGVSLTQYNTNPMGMGSSNSTSVTVQTDFYGTDAQNGRRSRSRRLADSLAPLGVTLVLQNTAPINYTRVDPLRLTVKCISPRGHEYTERRVCPTGLVVEVTCPADEKGNHIITCPGFAMEPRCTSFNGVEFVEDTSCAVVEFSSEHTTCYCDGSAGVVSSTRRYLQDIDDPVTVVAQYGTTFVLNNVGLESSFDSLPDFQDATYDSVVLSLTSVLLGVFVLVLVALAAWVGYHKRSSSKAISNGDVRRADRTIASFYEQLIPSTLRQDKDLPWRQLFVDKLLKFHTFASIVWFWLEARDKAATQRSKKAQTVVHRWIKAVGKLLTFLFFNTLLAYVAYPYDAQCEDITHEDRCESRKNTPFFHSCEWSEQHESCRFRGPDLETFQLLVCSCLVIAAAVLYNRVLDWVMFQAFTVTAHGMDGIGKALGKTLAYSVKAASNSQATYGRRIGGSLSSKKVNPVQVTSSSGKVEELPAPVQDLDFYVPRADEFKDSETLPLRLLRAARLAKSAPVVLYTTAEEERDFLIENVGKDLHRRSKIKFRNFLIQYDLPHETTVYEDLATGLSPKRMLSGVRYARSVAQRVYRLMGDLPTNEEREKLLMQCFIADSIPLHLQSIVRHEMFLESNMTLFGSISSHFYNAAWVEDVLALLCWCLLLAHFGAFAVVLIMLLDAAVVSFNALFWGVVLVISVFGYFLLLEPLVILLKHVLVVGVLAAEVVTERCDILARKSRIILGRRVGLMRDAHALVQHLNPACRAARSYPYLPVSRMLLSMGDSDLTKLTLPEAVPILQRIGNMFKQMPLLLFAYVPYQIGELLCDIVVIGSVICLALGLYYLGFYNYIAASVFAGVLVGVILLNELYMWLYGTQRTQLYEVKDDFNGAESFYDMQAITLKLFKPEPANSGRDADQLDDEDMFSKYQRIMTGANGSSEGARPFVDTGDLGSVGSGSWVPMPGVSPPGTMQGHPQFGSPSMTAMSGFSGSFGGTGPAGTPAAGRRTPGGRPVVKGLPISARVSTGTGVTSGGTGRGWGGGESDESVIRLQEKHREAFAFADSTVRQFSPVRSAGGPPGTFGFASAAVAPEISGIDAQGYSSLEDEGYSSGENLPRIQPLDGTSGVQLGAGAFGFTGHGIATAQFGSYYGMPSRGASISRLSIDHVDTDEDAEGEGETMQLATGPLGHSRPNSRPLTEQEQYEQTQDRLRKYQQQQQQRRREVAESEYAPGWDEASAGSGGNRSMLSFLTNEGRNDDDAEARRRRRTGVVRSMQKLTHSLSRHKHHGAQGQDDLEVPPPSEAQRAIKQFLLESEAQARSSAQQRQQQRQQPHEHALAADDAFGYRGHSFYSNRKLRQIYRGDSGADARERDAEREASGPGAQAELERSSSGNHGADQGA